MKYLIMLILLLIQMQLGNSQKQKNDLLLGFVFIDVSKIYFQKGLVCIMDKKDTLLFLKNKKIIINDSTFDLINDEQKYSKLVNVEAFYPEYGIFVLKCLAKGDNEYIVEINGKKGTIAKKGIEELTVFKSITKFVLETFPIPSHDNPIRINPNLNSKTVQGYEKWNYLPIEIKGDWLKVKNDKDCYKDIEPSKNDINGWIRWRENGRLILKVGYRC